jgi:hypothetical protein
VQESEDVLRAQGIVFRQEPAVFRDMFRQAKVTLWTSQWCKDDGAEYESAPEKCYKGDEV